MHDVASGTVMTRGNATASREMVALALYLPSSGYAEVQPAMKTLVTGGTGVVGTGTVT